MNYRGVKVELVDAETWKAGFSANAHLVAFGENKPASRDRIDFALLLTRNNSLDGYIVCREHDSESLYWQYGGCMPEHRGTPGVRLGFQAALEWATLRYKRVFFLVENKNSRMLKLALSCGFLITGVRTINGRVLLEHAKEL